MHNIQNNHVNDSVDGAKMYLTSTVTVISTCMQHLYDTM